MAPTRVSFCLVVLAALVFVSCGGGTTTVERTVTVAARTTPTTGTTQSGGSTGAATNSSGPKTGTAEHAPSEPPTRFVHRSAFQSPSGNIGCMLVGGVARCDIVKRDWSPPPRPASCPRIVDYGQGLEVGRTGAASVVCAGDTARDPSAPALAYGTASRVGQFVCVSRASGMTCTNRTNGHGFFISVQSYKLF